MLEAAALIIAGLAIYIVATTYADRPARNPVKHDPFEEPFGDVTNMGRQS